MVQWLSQWNLSPQRRTPPTRNTAGRSRVVIQEEVWDSLMFLAVWLDHLRNIARQAGTGDKVGIHLGHQRMADWHECWDLVRPYARARDQRWGSADVRDKRRGRWQVVVSASRMQEHAVWLAARRALAYLYGISERTLRRRIHERDLFGQRTPPAVSPTSACVRCGGPRVARSQVGLCDNCLLIHRSVRYFSMGV
jgi:hypothetical protein